MATTSRWRRWAVPAGVAVLVVFGPGLVEFIRLSVMEWRLDRRLATLARAQEAQAQEQERLTKDPAYVEGLIRTTFKLAKPGELVISLPANRRR